MPITLEIMGKGGFIAIRDQYEGNEQQWELVQHDE